MATRRQAINYVIDLCGNLGLNLRVKDGDTCRSGDLSFQGPSGETITVLLEAGELSAFEQVIRGVQFDFDDLPLFIKGDSKEIRLLTPRIALVRLLPTVYSYTSNRYGVAAGTDEVRARFSADVFRRMAEFPGPYHLATAFLGLVETKQGPLLAEEVLVTCNLEVRVKRYHIGSPVHRYRYTELHATRGGGEPLTRWDRFAEPVVCFDWRHPLTTDQGERLADEPLPDDYAALWLDDIAGTKRLASEAFIWIERLFAGAGLYLIDICFFIDRAGKVLYGEISPDCMRVRSCASGDAEALDKDAWRSGGNSKKVLERYKELHRLVFGTSTQPNRPMGDHHA